METSTIEDEQKTCIFKFQPHNIWFGIIKSIRDLILKNNCSTLIFRDNVDIPFLSGCSNGGFSRCGTFINKLHSGLRIIFHSGSGDIVGDSYYFLLTILTTNDFTKGDAVINSKNYLITFEGRESLWLELSVLVQELITFFTEINTSFCMFASDSQLCKCLDALTKMLSKRNSLIENIIVKSNVVYNKHKEIEYKTNKQSHGELIFVPDYSLCCLFNNMYMEFGSEILETNRQTYNVGFDEVKIITL